MCGRSTERVECTSAQIGGGSWSPSGAIATSGPAAVGAGPPRGFRIRGLSAAPRGAEGGVRAGPRSWSPVFLGAAGAHLSAAWREPLPLSRPARREDEADMTKADGFESAIAALRRHRPDGRPCYPYTRHLPQQIGFDTAGTPPLSRRRRVFGVPVVLGAGTTRDRGGMPCSARTTYSGYLARSSGWSAWTRLCTRRTRRVWLHPALKL